MPDKRSTEAQLQRALQSHPGLQHWLRRRGDQLSLALGYTERILEPDALMFDAAGNEYRVIYMTVVTALDGSGPVVPSNSPQTFRPLPAYPPSFQARDLSEVGERTKIEGMARGLTPSRLLVPHSDPTLGAPVVWIDPRSSKMYVLAGNGRTLALLRAPEDTYARYLNGGKQVWPDLDWTAGPPGTRTMLVRAVFSADGGILSMAEATRLAGASQASTAAEESPFGKALSTVRGLGLSFDTLPPVRWLGTITADNLRDFADANAVFVQAVLGALPKHKAPAYMNSAGALAELLGQVFVATIPKRVLEIGLDDPNEQAAVVAALPTLVTLHEGVKRGEIKPGWDLLPRLGLAFEAARAIAHRRMSVDAAVEALEREGQQGRIAGAKTLFAELDPLGLLFALAIKKAAARAAPDHAIVEYLRPFAETALSDSPHQSALFGGEISPVQTLAMAVDRKRLGARFRSNPATHNLSTDALSLLSMLNAGQAPLLRFDPAPAAVRELVQLGLARFSLVRKAVHANMGRLEATARGCAWWRREQEREAQDMQRRQRALF